MSDSGRERPNCEHGNDSQCPHCDELAALRTQLAAAEERAVRMEGALRRIVTEAETMPECPPPDHACPACEILFVATEALADASHELGITSAVLTKGPANG